MNSVAVIGIGNLSRGDDAIGILAARRIRVELPEVQVIESDGDITELLDCFRHFHSVYIIDAISSSSPASQKTGGNIFEFDAIQGTLPNSDLLVSSHVLGISQAIELARVLGVLPSQLRVLGVEGASFVMGEGISKEADLAIDRVASRMIEKIRKGVHSNA